jgi:hypothetical protein
MLIQEISLSTWTNARGLYLLTFNTGGSNILQLITIHCSFFSDSWLYPTGADENPAYRLVVWRSIAESRRLHSH